MRLQRSLYEKVRKTGREHPYRPLIFVAETAFVYVPPPMLPVPSNTDDSQQVKPASQQPRTGHDIPGFLV
jgi:hypothetical protein